MRILICDKATGLFYRLPGEWTECADSAENFHVSSRAIVRACEEGLRDVEIVWDFDDPEYNVRLPLENFAPGRDLLEAEDNASQAARA